MSYSSLQHIKFAVTSTAQIHVHSSLVQFWQLASWLASLFFTKKNYAHKVSTSIDQTDSISAWEIDQTLFSFILCFVIFLLFLGFLYFFCYFFFFLRFFSIFLFFAPFFTFPLFFCVYLPFLVFLSSRFFLFFRFISFFLHFFDYAFIWNS